MSTEASTKYPPLFSLECPPSSAKLIPPGQCQFGEEFVSAKLVERTEVTASSCVLRFALPNPSKPLQLSTCACILVKAEIDGVDVIRPYTPISTNDMVGYMDLLVKNYFDKGTMSKYLCATLPVGSSVQFKHIPFNVKIQAPFQQSNILMLTGGSGITPIIQALHAVLGSPEQQQKQKVTVLYGSQVSDDILGKSLLDSWAKEYPDKLEVIHVLSNEPADSKWDGKRGFISESLLKEYLPADINSDTLILVCGPPPMYQALCGPRDKPDEVTGILGQLGYTKDHVYKF